MNYFLKIFCGVLCVGIFNFAHAANKPVLDIQHWQTKNGAQVYFVAAPELPMLDVQVVFNAGSARDGKLAGLAQATNAMFNQGAGVLNADQIAAQFDNVGAQYGAGVNRDLASVQLRSLTDPKFLNPALQTLTAILTAPNFPANAWQRVQKQMLISLQAEQQSPKQIARNAFYKSLYGDQPYAHSVSGMTATISKLTPQDLQQFYKQYYVASNAIVAIVGAVDKQTAAKIAEQLVAQLPVGQAVTALPVVTGSPHAQEQSIVFPSQQTTVLIGQIGINKSDPDYFPLYVGNHVLGGGLLVSRLFEEVRNKRGLTYGINSSFVTLGARGPFYVGLQSRSDQAKTAIAVTQHTLQTFVNDGPTEQELMAAKKNIIGEFPLHFSNNADLLDNLVNIAFYNLPLDYYDTYRQKINAVTVQQVRNAFQQHIHPNNMIIVTVGESIISSKK